MSDAKSLELLEQWFDRLNEIESVESPPPESLHEMMNQLGTLITLLAFDFERHGLDSTEVRIAALKHKAHEKRHIVQRLEVVEMVSMLCGRLLNALEKPAEQPNPDPVSDTDTENNALDCLSKQQRCIVSFLLRHKHFVSVDSLKEAPGAFGKAGDSGDKAVATAIGRIHEAWLVSGIGWQIVSQDNSTHPRYKLKK